MTPAAPPGPGAGHLRSFEGEHVARILVVDDEPYITDLLGAALRFEGFTVEVAATGHEAIALSTKERHDLILLDVMLPDMNGTEVCRACGPRGSAPGALPDRPGRHRGQGGRSDRGG